MAASIQARSPRHQAPAQQRMAHRIALAWVLAKVLVISIWVAIAPSVQGDVIYYARQIHKLLIEGPQVALIEYPTPMLWVLRLPYFLSGGRELGYALAFIALLIGVDGAYTWALWRRSRDIPGPPVAVFWWLGFTFLLGPTAYLRFDLLPAVMAGMALLLLARSGKPGIAGAVVALGASFKLWPALLFAALLGRRGNRRRATIGFVASGIGLVLASLAYAGWTRLISPLTWQSDRGLQVESVWATGPMLQRLWRWDIHIYLSPHNAFEIIDASGTTTVWQHIATVATAIGLAIIVTAYARWFFSRRTDDLLTAGALMLLVTVIMIVTNKTFSPQYVMWLGGPMAAMLALGRFSAQRSMSADGWTRPMLMRLSTALLVLTFFTQLVYPIGYHSLVHDTPLTPVFTLVLVVRNLGTLALTAWLAILVWQRARRRTRKPV